MTLQRITVDAEIDGKLRYLTGRVGLKANLLCRLGLCLSFEEPGLPDGALYLGEQEGGSEREFNRYTLLGEYDLFFMSLLRERLLLDGLDPHDEEILDAQFKAHLGRGIMMLSSRLKGLEDLADLVTMAMDRCIKQQDPEDLPDELTFFQRASASPVEEVESASPGGAHMQDSPLPEEGTRTTLWGVLPSEGQQPIARSKGMNTTGHGRQRTTEDQHLQLPLQGFT